MMASAETGSPAGARRSAPSNAIVNYFTSRNAKFYLGAALVILIIGAAIFADLLPFADPYFPHRGFELKGPSLRFPFGADEIGRDLLSRIVYGGRPTLFAALTGVSIAALIGIPLGLASGLQGGWLDNITGRIADATFAMPTILIGVGLAAALGGGAAAVTTAIVIGTWPAFVRVSRAAALQEKSLPYVEALRTLGASRSRIIFRHILPNSIEPLIIQYTVALAIAVLVESGLSFLGMGTQPPSPSWGGLLADSRRFLRVAPHYAVFPGLAITLLIVGINFLVDSMSTQRRASSWSRRAKRRAGIEKPIGGPVFAVDQLSASFGGPRGRVFVLNGVSLDVAKGETLGVVGESGSGKSVTMFTAAGLNRRQDIQVESGTAWLQDRELLGMPESALRTLRGADIGMIFQNPATALNPTATIGAQVGEALRIHAPSLSGEKIDERVLELLQMVQLPDPQLVRERYPHQLSGGQRQRVVIAMAIANQPALIIADEPTTALDVTVQAQILELLKAIAARPDSSLVMITHDLGVVAEVADRVAVMYHGRVVETGPVDRIFSTPSHPYTRGLLRSIPQLDRRISRFQAIPGAPPRPGDVTQGCAFVSRCDLSRGRAMCRTMTPQLRETGDGVRAACHFSEEVSREPVEEIIEPTLAAAAIRREAAPLLSASNLSVTYRISARRELTAVRGVDIAIEAGSALGIVGESGCGKTSLLRALMSLSPPQSGTVAFEGVAFDEMDRSRLRHARRNLQIVQQDPSTALDRRMSVIASVREALDIHGIGTPAERDQRARDYLNRVGIGPDFTHRRPSELSGGQQQRVAIARALILHPRMLLLDEAFSALDLSVRAQVLNLLSDLRRDFGLTYVYVSHDLSVIRSVADEVAIMYLGRVIERGANEEIFERPLHPYTIALLSAVPAPDPKIARSKKRIVLQGDPPNPSNPPSGCAFRNRCWKAQTRCAESVPPLASHARGGEVACFFPEEQAIEASHFRAFSPSPSIQ